MAAGRLTKLESIRGFAAVVVLINHAEIYQLDILGRLGQEAVILFFFLSGFVIHYATFGRLGADKDISRAPSFRQYFIHRFRRIYPLFLISLAAAYFANCVRDNMWIPFPAGEFIGNLLMVQDHAGFKPGVWCETFCRNLPLWSLSYEWWFYMMFFPIFIVMARHAAIQKYVVGGLSAIGFVTYQLFPNAASLFVGYFFIWWFGVELSREYSTTGRITWKAQLPNLIIIGILTLLWAIPVALYLRQHKPISPGMHPALQLRHYAGAMAFILIGLCWYKARWPLFRYTIGFFSVLAPVSFALYIFHLPALRVARALMPGTPAWLHLLIVLPLLLPCCYLLEVLLQRRINKLLQPLEKPRSAPQPVVSATESRI